MEPTQELIDALYRDKVRAARRMSVQRRIEATCELCDMCRQMLRHNVRRRFPQASEQEINDLVRQRIALQKRLENTSLPDWGASG